jgi:hypothetical protein
MAVERDPNWHQDTPRMQIIALVGSALGDTTNLRDDFSPVPLKAASRASDQLEQATLILRGWPDLDTWDRPETWAIPGIHRDRS